MTRQAHTSPHPRRFKLLQNALEIAPLIRDANEEDTFVIFEEIDPDGLCYHIATGDELENYYQASQESDLEAVFLYDPPGIDLIWRSWMSSNFYTEHLENPK